MQPGRRKSHQSHAWRSLFRKQFHKTKPCHYYSLGQCRYGDECPFAHYEAELTVAPDLTKTTMCKAWMAGHCQLPSDQCQYAHGQEELRVTPAFEVSTLCKRRANQDTSEPNSPQGEGNVDGVQSTNMSPIISSLHGPEGNLNWPAEANSRHDANGTTDARGTAGGVGIHYPNDPNANRAQFGAMIPLTACPVKSLTLPTSQAPSKWSPDGNAMFYNQHQEPARNNVHLPSEDKGPNRAAKKRASKRDKQTAVVNLASLLPKDATQQVSSGFVSAAPFYQNTGLGMRVPFPAWPPAVTPGAPPTIVVTGRNGSWIPAVSNVPMTQMFSSQNSSVSPGMPDMQPGAFTPDRERACQTEPCKPGGDGESPAATSGEPDTETPLSGIASTSSASRLDYWALTPSSRLDWARTPSRAASPVSPKRWARTPSSASPVSPKRWGRITASEACPESPKLRWARTPSEASPERRTYWTRTPSSSGSPPLSPRNLQNQPAYVEPNGMVTFREPPDNEAYEDEPLSPMLRWTRTPSTVGSPGVSPARRIGGSLRLTNRGPPEVSDIRHRLADIFPLAAAQQGVDGGGPPGLWGAPLQH